MTTTWTQPGERWRLLAPEDVTAVSSWPPAARRLAVERLRALPSGAPVVLLDGRPGARYRTRRLAAAGGVVVERGYVAVPSLGTPIVFAEDTTECLCWVSRSLITTPPGVTRLHGVVDMAVRLLRRKPRLLAWLTSGCVVVGRRT